MVLADKARSSRAIREHLRERGIRAVIPVPADQRGHRLRRGSRGGSLRPRAYEQRNTVERCIRTRRRREPAHRPLIHAAPPPGGRETDVASGRLSQCSWLNSMGRYCPRRYGAVQRPRSVHSGTGQRSEEGEPSVGGQPSGEP
ncbi:transposase [Streptomyces alfalfae]|uniref:Transposase n=1 Tax=Streptomyces alfalfae TaxID=1642299 RepID=A0A7T4U156_9ACTN|nr:transposase [Streptomyces alfalfae]